MYKNIEKRLSELLLKFGQSPKNKGFHYLKAGIKFCLSDPRSVTNFSKVLYPKIAEKYETTTASVERAARHSIKSGWTRRDPELAHSVFGNSLQSEADVPSNALFVSAVTEYLKDDEE